MADEPNNNPAPTNPTDPNGGANPPQDPPKDPEGGGNDPEGKKLPENVPYSEYSDTRKQLREAKEALKKVEDEKKKQDEEKMKENNQFKELAETKDRELAETKTKYETSLKKVRFAELAMKEGVVNVDDAFRLANLEGVTVADDGSVSGMEDVIAKVKEGKPYLFGQQDQTLGGGSNPPKDGDTQAGKRIYKQSQIEDPTFYAANKADILKAYAEGRVVNE
jgi:hypothetical protein